MTSGQEYADQYAGQRYLGRPEGAEPDGVVLAFDLPGQESDRSGEFGQVFRLAVEDDGPGTTTEVGRLEAVQDG